MNCFWWFVVGVLVGAAPNLLTQQIRGPVVVKGVLVGLALILGLLLVMKLIGPE
jgi:hypothetical protein